MPTKRARTPVPRRGVRARTRAVLLDAALRIFARKGAGAASIQEITGEAGVANGTFYNYFRTHDEIVEAAGVHLTKRFHDAIGASYAGVSDPAERVAIGARHFIRQAKREPIWGAAIVRVWARTHVMHPDTSAQILSDLRAGRRRGRFHYKSETAALDLLQGTGLAAMRTVLEGRAGEDYGSAVAVLILCGLGVDAAEAEEIAHRPLPPLPEAEVGPPPRLRRQRRGGKLERVKAIA